MYIVTGLIGLWVFLRGMKLMKEGLENTAQNKMKEVLEKLTDTPLKACFTGIITTMLVQSSTAISVLSVGFVNAKIMHLKQAVGILLGANVGTCVTVQIISFDFTRFAIITGIIGIIIKIFTKKSKYQYIGIALFGFGCVFAGLKMMNYSFEPLQYSNSFLSFLHSLTDNHFFAILAGTIASALLHSSSAATGIAMLLSSQKLLPLSTAIAVVMGNNIGTCITAVIASLSGSSDGKRVALAHVILNVLGVLIFVPLLPAFTYLITFTADSLSRQVANAHTLFNVISSLIAFPLIGVFVQLIKFIIPDNNNSK